MSKTTKAGRRRSMHFWTECAAGAMVRRRIKRKRAERVCAERLYVLSSWTWAALYQGVVI